MSAAKYTDHAKVTAWTPRIKTDFSGPRAACAIELFRCVDTEDMQKTLDKMREIYQERIGSETA